MIYVFIAEGFEELEAISIIDILRRAKLEVKTVSITKERAITGTHKVTIYTDIDIDDVDLKNIQGIVLPGGMPGTKNLSNSEKLHEIVNYCANKKLLIGAICAAPSVLGKWGILKNKEVCCYPGFENDLKDATISNKYICISDNIVTGKGPGVANDFTFSIVSYLCGYTHMNDVRASMQCK